MDIRLLFLFVLNPIICFTLYYDAEVGKFFTAEGIENPTSREKALARKLIYERQYSGSVNKKLSKLEIQKEHLEGIIGAVVGREALESFRKYAKKYLPTKIPKVSYTAAEYQKAYVDCFMELWILQTNLEKLYCRK